MWWGAPAAAICVVVVAHARRATRPSATAHADAIACTLETHMHAWPTCRSAATPSPAGPGASAVDEAAGALAFLECLGDSATATGAGAGALELFFFFLDGGEGFFFLAGAGAGASGLVGMVAGASAAGEGGDATGASTGGDEAGGGVTLAALGAGAGALVDLPLQKIESPFLPRGCTPHRGGFPHGGAHMNTEHRTRPAAGRTCRSTCSVSSSALHLAAGSSSPIEEHHRLIELWRYDGQLGLVGLVLLWPDLDKNIRRSSNAARRPKVTGLPACLLVNGGDAPLIRKHPMLGALQKYSEQWLPRYNLISRWKIEVEAARSS
uniref:Uncharacterized protein n=1 Tax=Oryza glumipatula TaxID=40148 RepID=A0A0E0AM42_9ORYZ